MIDDRITPQILKRWFNSDGELEKITGNAKSVEDQLTNEQIKPSVENNTNEI